MPNLDLSDSPDILVGSTLSSALITTSNNSQTAEQKAIVNGVAIADVNDCIEIVRQANGIDSSAQIVVVYKTKDASLDLANLIDDNIVATSAIKVQLYDSNGNRLDTSVCTDSTLKFKVPLKDTKNVNMNKYRTFKDDGIDTFNTSDPAFTDRCFSYQDKLTGMDTTINYRMKYYYQSISAQCITEMGRCNYTEVNYNDYLNCDCKGVDPNNEVSGNLVPKIMNSVSDINLDVINCLGPAFVNIF
jgi:hypothetical protein